METLEIRLINIAQKIADMYQDKLCKEYYYQLCKAINVCREYHTKGQYDWEYMYEVVLDDGGIWEYAEYTDLYIFGEDIQNMWLLETYILICNCYLGCKAEHDYTPQDMEIRGENIPAFVNLLENIVEKDIDYKKAFDFFKENMCY